MKIYSDFQDVKTNAKEITVEEKTFINNQLKNISDLTDSELEIKFYREDIKEETEVLFFLHERIPENVPVTISFIPAEEEENNDL